MKTRRLLLVLIVASGVALGWWLERPRRSRTVAVVPIEDGKTIDFSSGAPVVKDSPEEKVIIAAALKEMDAATKDVTFRGTAAGNESPAPAAAPAPKQAPDRSFHRSDQEPSDRAH